MVNHYKILGVEKDATQAEIKSAFKKLASKHHPDVGGDEEKFKEINEAYQTLSDSVKRQQYDNPGFGSGGWNINEDMYENFNDIFNNANGGMWSFSGFNPGPRIEKGRSINHNLKLTLEELATGVSKKFHSKINDNILKIDIPAGTNHGDRIFYKGKGLPGKDAPGDLYITILEIPHENFERQNNDIYSVEKIDVWDALLGCKRDLITVNGKNLEYNIPAGIQPDFRIKLEGQGIKDGDHYVVIKLDVPKNLSEAERKIISAAKDEINNITRSQ